MGTTDRWLLICTIVAIALCPVMPSSQSLWIDEAQQLRYVLQPDFASWLKELQNDQFSEALMPLGMLVAWVGGKLGGLREWDLRAVNLPWTLFGIAVFASLGRRWGTPWAPLLFAVQPFVWFYTNEARPYALQIACGSALLWGFVKTLEYNEFRNRELAVLVVSGSVLIGTTLFGILTTGAVATVLSIHGWRERWRLSRTGKWIVSGGFLWALTVGTYYLVTLSRGAKGAKLWAVGISNVLAVIYELFGFSGLGPGREDLRNAVRNSSLSGIWSAVPEILPLLLLGSMMVFIGWGVIRAFRRPDQRSLITGLSLAIGIVVLSMLLLGVAADFPFWGRHLAPVFPLFVALLVLGLRDLRQTYGRFTFTTVLVLYLATVAASSGQLRFSPRHEKDDYRSAAALARAALVRGETVWWNADPDAARYYGLPDLKAPKTPVGIFLVRPNEPDLLRKLPPPDLIIASKADVYDTRGVLSEFIRERDYSISTRLKAFTVWMPSA